MFFSSITVFILPVKHRTAVSAYWKDRAFPTTFRRIGHAYYGRTHSVFPSYFRRIRSTCHGRIPADVIVSPQGGILTRHES